MFILNSNDKKVKFDGGAISWTYDEDTKEIIFTLTVKATGWVGLGISKESQGMKGLDIAIGGVKDKKGYIGVIFLLILAFGVCRLSEFIRVFFVTYRTFSPIISLFSLAIS